MLPRLSNPLRGAAVARAPASATTAGGTTTSPPLQIPAAAFSSTTTKALASSPLSLQHVHLPSPRVTAAWLDAHRGDSRVKILDASWWMPGSNRYAFSEFISSRIPGAQYFDIDAVAKQERGAYARCLFAPLSSSLFSSRVRLLPFLLPACRRPQTIHNSFDSSSPLSLLLPLFPVPLHKQASTRFRI
jgi:hypothetical protein